MPLSKKEKMPSDYSRENWRSEGRATLKLPGKVIFPRNQEQYCRIIDLSPRGAGLDFEKPVPPGSQICFRVDSLGTFDGEVIHLVKLRGGVLFNYSNADRKLISETIANYLEYGARDKSSTRDSKRIFVKDVAHCFVLESGEAHACEIVDIALSGALFNATTKPDVGTDVRFGGTSARVVRHTDTGFAVEFL